MVVGGTVEAAGALDIDRKRDIRETNLTNMMNGRGDSQRSADNKATWGWGVP